MGNKINSIKYWGIVFIILLLGFILRVYNLDFPSIGYHNMKENEYLSMAQEMLRTQDFISRRIYFYNAFDPEPQMHMYPQPPLVTYQILFMWKLFGNNLWSARLFNILFGILSIFIIYLIGVLLFKEKRPALLSALLLAIMPLAVFFSRNLQPESPAFFFMLLGNYLFLKYIVSLNKRYLFFGGVAFSLAWLYKFSFLFGLLPFIFCFPFKTILREKSEFFKTASVLFFSFFIIPLTIIWLKHIGQWEFEKIHTLSRIKFLELFSFDYWIKNGRMILWYLVDENFGWVFVLLAVFGILRAFSKKQKNLLEYYTIGWTVAIVPYSMFFSDFINQHNYYQMPFLALICISAAYAIESVSKFMRNFLKHDLFVYISCAVLILASFFVYDSLKRMFGTVFLGEDVAGESLKEFTQLQERIFLYSYSQGYAIARYAQRYAGWTDNLEEFKKNENKWNIRYICFYPAEFIHLLAQKNPPLFEYIKDNYHFKEAGITQEPQQIYYLILEKGKIPNSQDFLKNLSGKIQLRNIYKLFGRYIFFYSLSP